MIYEVSLRDPRGEIYTMMVRLYKSQMPPCKTLRVWIGVTILSSVCVATGLCILLQCAIVVESSAATSAEVNLIIEDFRKDEIQILLSCTPRAALW